MRRGFIGQPTPQHMSTGTNSITMPNVDHAPSPTHTAAKALGWLRVSKTMCVLTSSSMLSGRFQSTQRNANRRHRGTFHHVTPFTHHHLSYTVLIVMAWHCPSPYACAAVDQVLQHRRLAIVAGGAAPPGAHGHISHRVSGLILHQLGLGCCRGWHWTCSCCRGGRRWVMRSVCWRAWLRA